MSDTDLVLRGVLTAQAILALLLVAGFFGTIWPERGWPTRVVILGLAGVMVYVLTGQVKAFNLGIPFDAFSLVGLVAYAVLLTGLTWHWRQGTRRGR